MIALRALVSKTRLFKVRRIFVGDSVGEGDIELDSNM